MCSLLAETDRCFEGYNVAHRNFLAAIAALKASERWKNDGAANFASWLAGRYQVLATTAREWVRQAEALAQQPSLDAEYASGLVSIDQMKAVSRLNAADTRDDEVWVDTLPNWTVEELHREARKATARELDRNDQGRYVRMEMTSDERFMRIQGQLHPEEGAVLVKAIERSIPQQVEAGTWGYWYANGLVELAQTRLASDADRERATVVVHIDEATMRAGHGVASLESGDPIPASIAQQLACDSRIQTVLHDAHGRVIGIGHTSRNVPPWLYRILRERDNTCTFPTCDRDKFLQAHHIIPWPLGPTDEPNLTLTCTTHHDLVHKHGWTINGPAGPGMKWLRPDGTELPRRVLLDSS